MTSFTVDLDSVIDLTDEQFYQLCQKNRDLKFERSASGELIIMAPTGGDTGRSNFEIAVELGIWNRQTKLGVAFDSSTGFKLPNGANRSPDVAWIQQARWNALTPEQKAGFIPLCPDFVIELVSPSDRLTTVQEKRQEYRENGVQLGWLIDRKSQQVEIYRPNHDVEILKSPVSLAGEGILPGFVLSLDSIW